MQACTPVGCLFSKLKSPQTLQPFLLGKVFQPLNHLLSSLSPLKWHSLSQRSVPLVIHRPASKVYGCLTGWDLHLQLVKHYLAGDLQLTILVPDWDSGKNLRHCLCMKLHVLNNTSGLSSLLICICQWEESGIIGWMWCHLFPSTIILNLLPAVPFSSFHLSTAMQQLSIHLSHTTHGHIYFSQILFSAIFLMKRPYGTWTRSALNQDFFWTGIWRMK